MEMIHGGRGFCKSERRKKGKEKKKEKQPVLRGCFSVKNLKG
jgi:hypothetical protein